jgi:hypothetical protein
MERFQSLLVLLFVFFVVTFSSFYSSFYFAPSYFASFDYATKEKPESNYVLPILDERNDLGELLNDLNYTVGVELGVQEGHYSNKILEKWPKCEKFHLVDSWEHQPNYHDIANVDQNSQNRKFDTTKQNMQKWGSKIVFHRMYTNEAVKHFENNSVDFVYVDARHDYKGAKEDIQNWWPKIKIGGILAGHDFEDANDDPVTATNQDWSISADGTDNGFKAVKFAVEEFAKEKGIQPIVMRRETQWNTWYMFKSHE